MTMFLLLLSDIDVIFMSGAKVKVCLEMIMSWLVTAIEFDPRP